MLLLFRYYLQNAISGSYMASCYIAVSQRGSSTTNGYPTTMNNPVYDSTLPAREEMDDEREWDNPLYGVSDGDVLLSEDIYQDVVMYTSCL